MRRADAFDARLGLIARVFAALKAKGVRLPAVPVPGKVETHPELLGGRNAPVPNKYEVVIFITSFFLCFPD